MHIVYKFKWIFRVKIFYSIYLSILLSKQAKVATCENRMSKVSCEGGRVKNKRVLRGPKKCGRVKNEWGLRGSSERPRATNKRVAGWVHWVASVRESREETESLREPGPRLLGLYKTYIQSGPLIFRWFRVWNREFIWSERDGQNFRGQLWLGWARERTWPSALNIENPCIERWKARLYLWLGISALVVFLILFIQIDNVVGSTVLVGVNYFLGSPPARGLDLELPTTSFCLLQVKYCPVTVFLGGEFVHVGFSINLPY